MVHEKCWKSIQKKLLKSCFTIFMLIDDHRVPFRIYRSPNRPLSPAFAVPASGHSSASERNTAEPSSAAPLAPVEKWGWSQQWQAIKVAKKNKGNMGYPLVNIQKAMENHHFQWVNQLFLWPFSIAMLVYQRVYHVSKSSKKAIWIRKMIITDWN